MTSPPAYTPIPSDDPKSPLACTAPLPPKLAADAAHWHAHAQDDIEEDAECYAADKPTRRAAVRAALCTAVVAFVALGAVGYALCGRAGLAALGCGESNQQGGGHRWAKRQASSADATTTNGTGGGKEEFSTTTYFGEVTTYVKTTRPIVNPGGYTFGTMTGYVPVSSTTSGKSASASTSASDSLDSAESASSSSRSPTSVDASPTATASASASGTDSPAAQSSASAHVVRQVWASYVATAHHNASAVTNTPTAPASEPARRLVKRAAEPEPAWDFAAVDAHLLHRRGEDFEASASQATQDAAATTLGVEEFSTSTNGQGGVVTLVKTTRPIVNPGGYVIGTLDGAWVDVAKQTDRTTLPPSPSATISSTSSSAEASPVSSASAATEPTTTPVVEMKDRRRHEELRRRDVVDHVA